AWSIQLSDSPAPSATGVIRLRLPGSLRWMALLIDRDDFQSAAIAIADGACALLTLDSELHHFDRALHATADGDAPYIPADLARRMAQGALRQQSANGARQGRPVPRLTPREAEVLELVAAGLSNREIADRLTLSINTVRSHLQTLSTKLRASSRAKMVASAWVAGIYSNAEAEPELGPVAS
ncbi:MAG: LuxR C-terminal-related transcriptional regulator, partial [Tepidiformaceae bacterium]